MVNDTEYTCLMSKLQLPRGIHLLKTFFLSPFVKSLNEKLTFSSTRFKVVDCLVVVFPSLGQALSTWPDPQSLRQIQNTYNYGSSHCLCITHNYTKILTTKHNPVKKCRYFHKPDLQRINFSFLMQLRRYFFKADSGMLIVHKVAEPSGSFVSLSNQVRLVA